MSSKFTGSCGKKRRVRTQGNFIHRSVRGKLGCTQHTFKIIQCKKKFNITQINNTTRITTFFGGLNCINVKFRCWGMASTPRPHNPWVSNTSTNNSHADALLLHKYIDKKIGTNQMCNISGLYLQFNARPARAVQNFCFYRTTVPLLVHGERTTSQKLPWIFFKCTFTG